MSQHHDTVFDESLLSGYLDGELTQADEQRVRLRLEGDSEARTMVAEMQRIRQAARSTELAVPGWATYLLAFLAIIFLQTLAICFVTSFVVLNLKRQAPLIPERDHALFIDGFHPYPVEENAASGSGA